ncbi:MAG TPA: hypothetical protein PKA10_18295 [Selenomonadales bacterium]|nr:hypothetical protein [Selenomonadales bacterium]
MPILPFRLLLIDTAAHTVLLADGLSGELLAERHLPSGLSPMGLAFCRQTSQAHLPFAAGNGSGALYFLDLPSFTLERFPAAIPPPVQYALSPGGQRAYLADSSGAIQLIDIASAAIAPLTASVSEGRCVGLATDGERVYGVWERRDGGFTAAWDRSGQCLWQSNLGGIPTGLSLTAQGTALIPYTASTFSGEGVAIITPEAASIAPLQCSRCSSASPAYPSHAAISPDGATAYIVYEDHGTIGILDLATASITAAFPVGRSISRLALTADGKFAVASSNMFADLCLIDLVNRKLLSFTTDREILSALAIVD